MVAALTAAPAAPCTKLRRSPSRAPFELARASCSPMTKSRLGRSHGWCVRCALRPGGASARARCGVAGGSGSGSGFQRALWPRSARVDCASPRGRGVAVVDGRVRSREGERVGAWRRAGATTRSSTGVTMRAATRVRRAGVMAGVRAVASGGVESGVRTLASCVCGKRAATVVGQADDAADSGDAAQNESLAMKVAASVPLAAATMA
eukprot:4425886-Pleurochrysis_carterae.AAC.1